MQNTNKYSGAINLNKIKIFIYPEFYIENTLNKIISLPISFPKRLVYITYIMQNSF